MELSEGNKLDNERQIQSDEETHHIISIMTENRPASKAAPQKKIIKKTARLKEQRKVNFSLSPTSSSISRYGSKIRGGRKIFRSIHRSISIKEQKYKRRGNKGVNKEKSFQLKMNNFVSFDEMT